MKESSLQNKNILLLFYLQQRTHFRLANGKLTFFKGGGKSLL